MSARRILVVEDDRAIRQGLVDALAFGGYETLAAGDGGEGLKMALSAAFDLLLLDLVLPKVSGFDILQEVRKQRATLPVIILSARGEEQDRVRGLNLGADDYVVKPFSATELLARVRAVLRRSPERPHETEEIGFPGGTADLARCEVRYGDGKRAELSPREVELLRYLGEHRGRVISREELFVRVWRLDHTTPETRVIDMHIANLRSKLRDDPAAPKVILTVRGKGYSFAEAS